MFSEDKMKTNCLKFYLCLKHERDQIASTDWITEKTREFRKTSASLTTLKPLTVCITTNCGKFLKRRKYHTTLPAS